MEEMRRNSGDGAYKTVLGIALILAGIILFYIGQRNFFGKSVSRRRSTAERPAAAPADPEATFRPPPVIPPMKLKAIEKRGVPQRKTLPDRPQPPIKPDRE